MTTLIIAFLTVAVCWLVVRDWLAERAHRRHLAQLRHPSRRDLPIGPVLRAGDGAYLVDHPGDLDTWTDYPPDPHAPIYTDVLAQHEAARADWSEIDRWRA